MTISDDQWEQVTSALRFYIAVKTEELKGKNVGDVEWQQLVDYENTLSDIEYFILGNK